MNNNNRGNSSNNNNNNNRRRGRGNRQGGGGGGGGGQQLNRIDSRARGNAPQLLEKYRKLAHDAHLNGDRVQAEYYLQYADHYFRVLADSRVRQEEQRSRAPGERWQEGADESDDAGEFTNGNDFPSFDNPNYGRPQRDERPLREDRPQREERPRPARQAEDERDDAPQPTRNEAEDESGPELDAQGNPYEPAENPFVRENRSRVAGLRPRRAPRPERESDRGKDEPAGLDPASLPPAISATRGESEGEAEAKPRRKPARRKPSAGDAGEALESVN